MNEKDINSIFNFFSEIPSKDKLYLQEDVAIIETIKKWIHRIKEKRTITVLGEIAKILCAEATLHQEAAGWSKHVGNIRINI